MKLRVMWMTRKSSFVVFFCCIGILWVNLVRLKEHRDRDSINPRVLSIKAVMYLSKPAFTVIFCVVLCTHTYSKGV